MCWRASVIEWINLKKESAAQKTGLWKLLSHRRTKKEECTRVKEAHINYGSSHDKSSKIAEIPQAAER